ncbi:MAG: D-alanine--D-alanine ligase [Planctomycetes bacterium]|nr:D-alanine--D-alanine ligase [Planctomycetota bacterium]
MLSTAQHRRIRWTVSERDGARQPSRLHIAVLLGGVGHERSVSLISGRAVIEALELQGHRVTPVVLDSSEDDALDAIPVEADLAFIALHGEYGEDGTIQQALARRGVIYTGSGPESSARAFDKLRAKRHFSRAGIPLAWHRVLDFPTSTRGVRHAVRMTPGLPVVVKPSRCGSSVGVTICKTRDQLTRALEEGARFRQPLLIEEFIPGRELTCGVLGDTPLAPVEAVAQGGFFDFSAKYDKQTGTRYVVDPELPSGVRDRIQTLAFAAHQVLGCSDFSRTDFRYDPIQDRLAVLELNTIPGLTPTSLLPMAAAHAGLNFSELAERFCRLAIGATCR